MAVLNHKTNFDNGRLIIEKDQATDYTIIRTEGGNTVHVPDDLLRDLRDVLNHVFIKVILERE